MKSPKQLNQPGYYSLFPQENPEPEAVHYYRPTAEQLQKAIRKGNRHKLRLMYGAGLFREWQMNPIIGEDCWVIDADMQVKRTRCDIKHPDFVRPYKNFMTFLTKKEAVKTRARLVRMLRDVQVELYANFREAVSRRKSIQIELFEDLSDSSNL